MSLKEKINNDLKDAMKSQDKLRMSTIRSIRALILEYEKSGANKELNPEDEIKMLSTAAKKRRESIEQFEICGRTELAEKEKHELEIIQQYLPKQLTEDEILAKVTQIAAEVGAISKADFGKLMPMVIKELKGQADGNTIRKYVEQVLS